MSRRALCSSAVFLLALLGWLGSVRVLFVPSDVRAEREALGESLVARQRALLQAATPERERAIARMRRANEEWDFMGRTFAVLALANDAIARPHRAPGDLAAIDAALAETLALEAEHGQSFFLMDYAGDRPFVQQPARSVFVDGEIALMLAARQLVEPEARWEEPLRERVALIAERFAASEAMLLESYPDEGWTFCNALAIAAIHLSDASTDGDHEALVRAWLASARARLIDPTTGLFVSSFRYDGTHLDGPEGSTIFLVADALSAIDPELARDQYARARLHLVRRLWGFAWASEWPAGWRGPEDVDSGPVVPIVDASAGASGMAILGAAAFDDDEVLSGLFASLDLAAFPVHDGLGLRYAASNQVGDAVMAYATTRGPLFERARRILDARRMEVAR